MIALFAMSLRKATAASIHIPANGLAAVVSDAFRWAPVETGGILMGVWDESGNWGEIVCILGGGPRAERTETSFDPDQHWQEEQVSRIYEQNDRTISYLGDWHTHPDGGPRMSSIDKKVARLIGAASAARCASPLIWIIGMQEQRLAWQAYRLKGRRFAKVSVGIRPSSAAQLVF